MTEVSIKPLRTYEDRGVIRRPRDGAYLAPKALASELSALGLCELSASETAQSGEAKEKAAGRVKKASTAAAGGTEE